GYGSSGAEVSTYQSCRRKPGSETNFATLPGATSRRKLAGHIRHGGANLHFDTGFSFSPHSPVSRRGKPTGDAQHRCVKLDSHHGSPLRKREEDPGLG